MNKDAYIYSYYFLKYYFLFQVDFFGLEYNLNFLIFYYIQN